MDETELNARGVHSGKERARELSDTLATWVIPAGTDLQKVTRHRNRPLLAIAVDEDVRHVESVQRAIAPGKCLLADRDDLVQLLTSGQEHFFRCLLPRMRLGTASPPVE